MNLVPVSQDQKALIELAKKNISPVHRNWLEKQTIYLQLDMCSRIQDKEMLESWIDDCIIEEQNKEEVEEQDLTQSLSNKNKNESFDREFIVTPQGMTYRDRRSNTTNQNRTIDLSSNTFRFIGGIVSISLFFILINTLLSNLPG